MLPPAEVDRELRHHAVALRRIAHDLLRDPHAADDVVQETMHRALAQKGLRPGPLGGWLHRVLENFVRQWRRGERRRLAREARVLPREAEPDPFEATTRRESLQTVTDAVLQLAEPYQTTILLRYFEDLPPRTIAKRTGVNVATVKSRLQRGLVVLRQRLDREHSARDEWRQRLAVTFGLPFVLGEGAALATGAWIMGSTTKVLLAAGALCLGGVFAWQWWDDPAPRTLTNERSTTNGAAVVAAPNEQPAASTTEREAPPAVATAPSWLLHPYVLELEVVVVDATGVPVEGVTPQLAPPRVGANFGRGSTDAKGNVVLSWPSRTPTGEAVVTDPAGTLRRVALQHGRRTAVTVLQDTGVPQVMLSRVVTTTGTGIQFLSELPVLGHVFTSAEGAGSSSMGNGLHQYAVFGDATALAPKTEYANAEEPFSLSEGTFLTRSRLLLDTVGVAAQPEPTQKPAISGTVLRDDGKPAAHAPVALFGSGAQPLQRNTTDDDGRFTFEDVVEGTFTVRAGGDRDGLAIAPAVVTTGTTPVRVDLRRDACVHGRVVRSDAAPHAPYRVRWRAEDGSWCDQTLEGDDGTFVFANLPAKAGDVYLALPGQDLPVAAARHVLTDNGELVLRHDVATARAISLEPVLPDVCKDAAVEVRVWQLDTGLGTMLARPEAGKPWKLEFLPPGWYQIEVRAQACGFVDLGRHWLDGTADLDLGRVVLPLPGRVHFVMPDDSVPRGENRRAFDLCELRNDLDVRVLLAEFPTDRPVFLPAGDYVFAFRHRDGDVRFVRFTARSGEDTNVVAR